MLELPEDELLNKLQNLEQKNKIATEQLEKYKNMTFAQVIQEPENIHRLKRCEEDQKQVFFNLIKKRHELKHLKSEQDDLFAMYFTDFLKGKVVSINDFFYENCGDTDAITFFKKREKILRKEFKHEGTP